MMFHHSSPLWIQVKKDKKRLGSYLLSRDERSTIGVGGLDFRVRDGNGYDTSAMATEPDSLVSFSQSAKRTERIDSYESGSTQQYGQASRLISTGRLNMLPCVDLQPIDQVFSLVPSVP